MSMEEEDYPNLASATSEEVKVVEAMRSSNRAAGTLGQFRDDASLPAASSTIRFRATANTSRVYPDEHGQFVIEDDFDEEGIRSITTRRIETTTMALRGLRATYTLVALFWTGFLFVFCLELLLYVILDLTIEMGTTSKGESFNPFTALGSLLSLPLYIHGLACALVIALQYVGDTWSGHSLVKKFVFGRFNGVVTEWVAFSVFLGVPVFITAITLFAGLDNWWELASLSWFCCICIFYILFAATIVAYENRACWEVTRNRYDNDDDSWPQVIRRAVLLRQRHVYGGKQHTTYLAKGAVDAKTDKGITKSFTTMKESHRITSNVYTKFISLEFFEKTLKLYTKLEVPERLYTLDDVKGERPFITADTWSLESIYCRPTNARYIAVMRGPQALTVPQMRSSLACSLVGNLLILLLVASFLWWMDLPGLAIMTLVILVVVFFMYPGLKKSYRIFLMSKDLILAQNHLDVDDEEADIVVLPEADDEGEEEQAKAKNFLLEEEESEGIFQVWETYRIINVTERMCWIIFGIEFVFLFAWPFASLVAIGNYATAGVFFFVALFSSLRTYFNAAIVLEETGTLDLVDGEKGSRRHWQNMSRLSTIVTKVTRSRARKAWMGILCFFLVAFLGLLGLAVTQEGDTSSDFEFTYLPDFEYVQQDDLMYPTCSFGKGLESLGSPTTDMADYAYLAALAYRDPSITQNELNQWFGDGIAVDNQTYVDDYRDGIDDRTAVSYKLITFPAAGNLAMVCIRGTTNAWDALTDAQLWAAAGVFQGLRALLPLGGIWTPILHRMVNIVSWLASESIERVSFYKETTKFVNFLKTTNLFGNIQVTGHSLGGGLSIITGAQTGVAAVALSGPNAILSRESFDPPITEDALDTLTFNIVPDRDIVPRLDDLAKLNQHIRCTAPINDFVGCHDGRRSVCEIIFTCGTNFRPALCDCTTEFGYPEPTPKEGVTTTFAEACAALITPP